MILPQAPNGSGAFASAAVRGLRLAQADVNPADVHNQELNAVPNSYMLAPNVSQPSCGPAKLEKSPQTTPGAANPEAVSNKQLSDFSENEQKQVVELSRLMGGDLEKAIQAFDSITASYKQAGLWSEEEGLQESRA